MPRLTRRTFIAAAAALPVARMAHATQQRVATNSAGIAMQGYDTRAYWTIGAPREGDARFMVQWRDKPWYFATAEDAAAFSTDALAFEPQFGGYCTRAMSFKKIVDGDPQVWRIYNGKLYLFARPVGGTAFDEGQDAMIAKAQAHWETLGQS